MKYLKKKDKLKRLKFFSKELDILKFKFLFLQKSFSYKFHSSLFSKFSRINKNFFSVRFNNRCIKTNKSGSILRKFKISRIEFRRLSSSGKLCGIKKSSW